MFNYLLYGCFKKDSTSEMFNDLLYGLIMLLEDSTSEMFNDLLYGCFKKTVQVKCLITCCTDALRRQHKWNV